MSRENLCYNTNDMKHKRWIIWITVILMLIGVASAFAYGKMNADGNQKSYYDSLNEFDWSNTCPAAGCRNNNNNKEDKD